MFRYQNEMFGSFYKSGLTEIYMYIDSYLRVKLNP